MKAGSLDSLMSEDAGEDADPGGLTDAAKDVREALESKDDKALSSALQRFISLSDEDDADDGPDSSKDDEEKY